MSERRIEESGKRRIDRKQSAFTMLSPYGLHFCTNPDSVGDKGQDFKMCTVGMRSTAVAWSTHNVNEGPRGGGSGRNGKSFFSYTPIAHPYDHQGTCPAAGPTCARAVRTCSMPPPCHLHHQLREISSGWPQKPFFCRNFCEVQ